MEDLIGLGAGTGAVFILRWYWWRINAWSEISAMAASFVTSIALHLVGVNAADTSSSDYARAMLINVLVTTGVWLAVTLLTPPETDGVLDAFYRRVRPGGRGWRRCPPGSGMPGTGFPVGARLGQLAGGGGGGLCLALWSRRVSDGQPSGRVALFGCGDRGFLVDPA